MPKSGLKYVLLLALAFVAPLSLAESVAPEALLRAVAADVIGKLKSGQEFQAADRASVEALVESKIVPLFDFDRITRLAVARNWHLATPAQQSVLTQEFQTLLMRSYASALARYNGEPILFRQLRATPPGTEATVRSKVQRSGKEGTILDYEMEKTAAGWKIYNIKVADVCLVSTYRGVFAEKVRSGGVDGLIKFLTDQNRGGDSRFNSIKTSVWEQSRMAYAILRNVIRSGLH